MKRPKFGSRENRVEFCDRCGQVCGANCRVGQRPGRVVEQALARGFRLL